MVLYNILEFDLYYDSNFNLLSFIEIFSEDSLLYKSSIYSDEEEQGISQIGRAGKSAELQVRGK